MGDLWGRLVNGGRCLLGTNTIVSPVRPPLLSLFVCLSLGVCLLPHVAAAVSFSLCFSLFLCLFVRLCFLKDTVVTFTRSLTRLGLEFRV